MEKLKVVGLMTLLTLLLVGLGGYFLGQAGALLFFVVSLAMNFGMYWFSDRLVIKQYRAHEVRPGEEGGRFDELYEMVDRLRQRAGLPMPRVAVAEQAQPNAFATGRNYDNALVCVTRGMWELVQQGQMSSEELEGVMAHELAHVQHRHMLVGTIAASMAGAVMLVARWGVFFGGRNNRGSPVTAIALMILAPVAAMVVQSAVSRRNEFEADAAGAEISGKPLALASALQRMDEIAERKPMQISPAAAHLAIVNPLAGAGGFTRLFRTHPPTEDRVARLRQIATREDVGRLAR